MLPHEKTARRVQLEVADNKRIPPSWGVTMAEGSAKSLPVVETTGGKVSGYA